VASFEGRKSKNLRGFVISNLAHLRDLAITLDRPEVDRPTPADYSIYLARRDRRLS